MSGASQGLFIANIQMVNNGDRGKIQVDVNAGGKPVVSAAATHHFYTGSQRKIPTASVAVPVPFGTTPLLTSNPTSGSPQSSGLYFPFLDQAPMLGSWINMFSMTNGRGTTKTVTASSDGFLLVTIKALGNGPRGMVRINMETSEGWEYPSGSSIHTYTGSDDHISQNSFCVPIPAGTDWNLYYSTSSEGVEYTASWIPLSSNCFKAMIEVASGEVIQATTDGFLFGRVWATSDGGHGSMALQVSEDKAFESSMLVEGLASQNWHPDTDIYVSVNSAMVPVKKGAYYRIVSDQGVASSTKAYFVAAPDFFTPGINANPQLDNVAGCQDCLEPKPEQIATEQQSTE